MAISVFSLIVVFRPSGAAADEKVETVRMLSAAHSVLMDAFPEGALTAVVDDQYAGRRADVSASWRKMNYFCDAATELARNVNGHVVTTEARFLYIRKGKHWDYYFPKSALLQRVSDGRSTGWSQLMLEPAECWFAIAPGSEVTFRDHLEEFLKPDSAFHYEVHDAGDGIIRIESQHNSHWDRAVTMYSMKYGGAVVSHEVFPVSPEAEVRARATYSWLPTDKGHWRLEKFKYQMTDAADDQYSDPRSITITVTSFDPRPKIASNRFEISSLALPKGTWVEELGANERRYRIGGNQKPEAGISDDKFRALAERLGKSRFGAAKND